MKTDRINSTMKGREKTTVKKVGRVEMWFRGEMGLAVAEWRMIWSQRRVRGRKRGAHSGECTRRTFPHGHWLGKREGLEFVSSCNKQGLKPGALKVKGLGWDRA